MIRAEISDINQGKIFIATISVQDSLAGFITCYPVQLKREDLKTEVYISLLAAKPMYCLTKQGLVDKEKKQLVDSAMNKFIARSFTLDTRHINTSAISFYKRIGFKTSKNTYDGSDPEHYIGCKKQVNTAFKSNQWESDLIDSYIKTLDPTVFAAGRDK